MTSSAPRLHGVRPLSASLPAGTESGKEFARIVNLLLYHDSRRRDIAITLFDDASGDYEGLDSYSNNAGASEISGYQYKFFPSPFTDQHRREIIESVRTATTRAKRLRLSKYVIVTPTDMTNHPKRKDGGDVRWFKSLRDRYSKHFELEHIGHTKLIGLFLQAPYLCLFYYPSLVPDGMIRLNTILELRAKYDDNMRRRFGRIEFVGMSIYKEEASRQIPLEKIYIPLSLVSETSSEETDDTPRIIPEALLEPGRRSVILGDPGSGKSTVISFLSLCGISTALQRHFASKIDNRLSVRITLRRYADELKERSNLSLLDYIVEVARGDFSLTDLDTQFFLYYLTTGQAIALFDGLDELPGPHFKRVVRDRIDAFATSFPGNTIVVTSRIVGYEADLRFDETYFALSGCKVTDVGDRSIHT